MWKFSLIFYCSFYTCTVNILWWFEKDFSCFLSFFVIFFNNFFYKKKKKKYRKFSKPKILNKKYWPKFSPSFTYNIDLQYKMGGENVWSTMFWGKKWSKIMWKKYFRPKRSRSILGCENFLSTFLITIIFITFYPNFFQPILI